MRTLFGAVLGVLFGGALMAVFTSAFNIQDYWPILLAGLIAGFAMRKVASDHHTSYLRGGLAALATVLAMIAGPLVGAKLISQKAPSIAKIESPAADTEEGTAAAGKEGALEAAELPMMPTINQAEGMIGRPKGQENPLDVVLIVAGCLIAYQVGKGSEDAGKEQVADATPGEGPKEGQSPAAEEASEEPSEEA